jgi:hypothetical protein
MDELWVDGVRWDEKRGQERKNNRSKASRVGIVLADIAVTVSL